MSSASWIKVSSMKKRMYLLKKELETVFAVKSGLTEERIPVQSGVEAILMLRGHRKQTTE